MQGHKITKLSPVVRLDIDGEGLAEELFRAYLRQILIDGFFHADPHPGNVFLTEDGRIALLDLGMVSRISKSRQEELLKLLLAVAEGRGEQSAEIAIAMGQHLPEFDREGVEKGIIDMVTRYQDAKLDELYDAQKGELDEKKRYAILRQFEQHALNEAYTFPTIWWHRIIINWKQIKGWHMSPSHYLNQDLSDVWLDQ